MTSSKNGRRRQTKMEDNVTQKWKTTSPKNGRRPKPKKEDDLTPNGRQPHPKLKTTSSKNERRLHHKMEDDLTVKKEDDYTQKIGRRPKNKMTRMVEDQNGKSPKWKTTKIDMLRNLCDLSHTCYILSS